VPGSTSVTATLYGYITSFMQFTNASQSASLYFHGVRWPFAIDDVSVRESFVPRVTLHPPGLHGLRYSVLYASVPAGSVGSLVGIASVRGRCQVPDVGSASAGVEMRAARTMIVFTMTSCGAGRAKRRSLA